MRNLKKYSNHSGPGGYMLYDAEVEYLEIPVGAYIDSGIVPANTTGIWYKYKKVNQTLTAVAGYRHSNYSATYFLIQGYSTVVIGTWNATNREVSISPYDEILTCEFNYYNSRTFVVNGTQTTGSTLEELSFTPTKSLYLGAVRIADADLYTNSQKHFCYGAKITQGDELILDLIPVRVGTVGYMYDKVSGQLFGNSGSGSFVLGEDVGEGKPADDNNPELYDAEVEYLQSSSDAYIDTDIAGNNNNLRITGEFMYSTHVNYGAIYGNYVDDSHNGTRLILNGSNEALVCLNTKCTTGGNTVISCQINTKHEFDSTYSTIIIDGVSKTTNKTTGTANSGNIALFNRSLTNPITRDIGLKIYWLKIYDSDILVRDFIPVRINRVGYMYDKVSGELFGNEGTGNFQVGNDTKVLKQYVGNKVSICKAENHTHYDREYPYDSKVVYIEFPVGAYIDSGIIPTDSTGFSFKGQRLVTAETGLIGYRHTSGNAFFWINGTNAVGYFYYNANQNSLAYSTNSNDFDQIVDYKMNLYNSRKFAVDNIIADYDMPTLAFTPDKTLFIGGIHYSYSGIAGYTSVGKRCFGCVITEGNQVVRDYTPVRIGEVGYLYDRVSGQLFGNVGLGTITVGNDIV